MSEPYDTDLNDVAWSNVDPHLPVAMPGGRPRTANLRAVVNANLLPTPHRLPVATPATGIPAAQHGLSLFQHVKNAGRLDQTPMGITQAGSGCSWSHRVPYGCHYGWAISENDREGWNTWVRRA